MMDAKAYRRALAQLDLTISGKTTTDLLGINARTSRSYAQIDNQPFPVPEAIELALRLMVKHKENPEAWVAVVGKGRPGQAPARYAPESRSNKI